MGNEQFEEGDVCEYKEDGNTFAVKVIHREVRPFSPDDKRVFLFLTLERLDDGEQFEVCHSLEPEDKGAEYLCWRLFPKGTYLVDETH